MTPRSYTFNAPANPLLQILYFVLGGILLVGALVIGAVVLSVAIGIALIVGIIVYIRVWWLTRQLARSGGMNRDRAGTLEVEYTVLDERDEHER